MANSIDLPPLYDILIKGGGGMSDIWTGWMSQFVQTLIQFLNEFGVFMPKITTEQRDSIEIPENGQMIYNTTLGKFQGYESGAWKTFTTS